MRLPFFTGFPRSQGRHLQISGIKPDVAAVLQRSGPPAKIAPKIFPREANPTIATKHALQRAQNLLGRQVESRLFYLAGTPS